ncbi:MAG: fumarylacetoacetate hydrolase family protein [Candidatus Krumholzibacteriia bacterium]
MKLITFRQGSAARPGLALDDGIGLDLLGADPSLPPRWNEILPDPALMARVRALGERARRQGELRPATALFALDGAALLPPIPEPSKIVAVGLNYRDHAAEQKKPTPAAPLLFAKAPSCLQGPHGPIELAAELDQVDAEAELAVVIGRGGRAIARERAREHIAGYMCFNDVSDRRAQHAESQWFRGKSLDTGGPCGPWLVTPDELPDLAADLAISARWNGVVMQESRTSQLIFPVDALIAYASRHMTLMPGDILSTGTPAGVGVYRDPQVFLKPGDTVEVTIEGIGRLLNPVTAR